jgi:hypothetical protein
MDRENFNNFIQQVEKVNGFGSKKRITIANVGHHQLVETEDRNVE